MRNDRNDEKSRRLLTGFGLALLLILCLCIGLATADDDVVMNGTCGKTENDHVFWEITGMYRDTVRIYGMGEMADDIDPWYQSQEITLTKVIIEDGITYIGRETFASSYYKEVQIAGSVKRIGSGAFAGTGIDHLVLPEGLESIGTGAFAQSSIKSVTFPESMKDYGGKSFFQCTQLKTVTFPQSLKRDPDISFDFCTNLQEIRYSGSKRDFEERELDRTFEQMLHYSHNISDYQRQYIHIRWNVTVTFDYGGHGGNNTQVKQWSGLTIDKPQDPAEEHYVFTGWMLNGVPYDFSTPLDDDITLTAGWKKRCKVSWKTDESTLLDVTEVLQGEVPSHAAPVKADDVFYTYTFTGWDPAIAAVQDDTTFTAQFTKQRRTYTLTFDGNGSSNTMESQRFSAGISARMKACTLSNPAGPFKGWNTAADGSGEDYADQERITLTEDLTLYAQWGTVEPNKLTGYLWGDVNGDNVVNGKDSVRLMKFLSGEIDPETGDVYKIVVWNADVNGDGKVNELDLLRLVKELGKDSAAPTEGINDYQRCPTCQQYIYYSNFSTHVRNCRGN